MRKAPYPGSILFTAFFAILLTVPAWSQAPGGLTVKTATSKRVDLTWTGAAASYTVQRALPGGSFSDIATASTTTYSDTTIDAYSIYQYQVVAGSSLPSNRVTVGPPPSGLTVAAPAPIVGTDPTQLYGWDLSLALDGNGDPAFTFIWEDPNNDGDYSDTALMFRSWNRASYTWNAAVKIAAVGDLASYFHLTSTLAYDASTGIFAAATEFAGGSVDVYTSSDGLTWTRRKNIAVSGSTIWGPSVVLAGGNIHLAINTGGAGVQYITGRETDATTWVTKTAPKPAGTNLPVSAVHPSLALDSSGTPGIAYWVADATSATNLILLYWKPSGSATPVKVLDTQGRQSGEVAVRLVYYGLNPRVVVYAQRNDAGAGIGNHFAQSNDGGLSWQPPVVIPPDGTSTTDYPFDMSIGSQGQIAVAFGQMSGTGDATCGNPKLSRSTDGVKFTTCAIASNGVLATIGAFPGAIQLAFGGDDKLSLLWWEQGTSPANTGIVMYREPAANAVITPVITSVSDGASFRPNIVAGSWVTIKGSNLADQVRIWLDSDFAGLGNALPTNLSGVQVKVNGVAAAVYYISSGQVNFQAPSGISGNVTVQAFFNNVASNTITATAVAVAPALFSYQVGETYYPAAVYLNSLVVGDPAVSGSAVAKAKAGDLIQLYGTGLSTSPGGTLITPFVVPTTVTAKIGTADAVVQYAGLTAVGEFQINIYVPRLPPGLYPVVITTAGQSSQPLVMIPIQ